MAVFDELEADPRRRRAIADDPPRSAISASADRVDRVDRVERTRDRLELDGGASLTDSELVTLVLRTGGAGRDASEIAQGILRRFSGLRGLSDEPTTALLEIPGLGPARAASLSAALELGRRSLSRPLERGHRIESPRDVQRHFHSRLRDWRRESFHVVLLDGRHRLIGMEAVSLGTLTASLVHPREVFREAIRRAAAAMLLVHNHPSGDPSPSQEDRAVTRRLQAAGELLGIRVLDHVIVAEDGYFSFREDDPAFGASFAPGERNSQDDDPRRP
jgi:DNA repair protein RadC